MELKKIKNLLNKNFTIDYNVFRKNSLLISILNASSDGILVSDNKGNVIYVNDAYENITGLKKSDLVRKNLNNLLNLKTFNFSACLYALEKNKPITITHKYITGKSALTSANLIYDDKKNIIGAFCNTRSLDNLMKLNENLNKTKMFEFKYPNKKCSESPKLSSNNIIAISPCMKEVLKLSEIASKFDSTVTIHGETGTGKEVISKYIHDKSHRKNAPFIKINCAAIPSELFESELFGYETGAFTGANKNGKLGMFELANGGTILLDEISELHLNMQSKLLRILQEKEFFRVGGSSPIKLDVRIISAANKDLKKEVELGKFREDLYFRLNVFPINLPPLRERHSDIEPLVLYFLEKLNKKYNNTVTISEDALLALNNYTFPGNVRELQNLVEYLFITSINDEIIFTQLPNNIINNHISQANKMIKSNSNLNLMLDNFEKTILIDELKKHSSIRKTSKALGIHPSTLCRKIKKYNLEKYTNENIE